MSVTSMFQEVNTVVRPGGWVYKSTYILSSLFRVTRFNSKIVGLIKNVKFGPGFPSRSDLDLN